MKKEDLKWYMVLRLTRDVVNPCYHEHWKYDVNSAAWEAGTLFLVQTFVGAHAFTLTSPRLGSRLMSSHVGVPSLIKACEVAPLTFDSIMLGRGVENENVLRGALKRLCDSGKISLVDLDASLAFEGDEERL